MNIKEFGDMAPKDLRKRGDFLCGCYKSWILEWKIIFPHY